MAYRATALDKLHYRCRVCQAFTLYSDMTRIVVGALVTGAEHLTSAICWLMPDSEIHAHTFSGSFSGVSQIVGAVKESRFVLHDGCHLRFLW